jgi:hypothetical protein
MVLTYMSITFSYVPMVLKGISDNASGDEASAVATAEGEAAQGQPVGATGAGDAPAPGIKILGWLFIFGLAMVLPFLAGAENFMGWIIIGIALYEAWKINRRVPLSGPFRLRTPDVAFGAPSGPPGAPPSPGVA